jgi:hypothetical protein
MSFISRKFKLGLVATALAMTAVVSVSYAFAAANTVPPSKAGYKTSVVSGYTVSAIHSGGRVDHQDPDRQHRRRLVHLHLGWHHLRGMRYVLTASDGCGHR